MFGVFAAMVVSGFTAAREAARETVCRGRMCKLQLALRNYHEVYGSFPPAYIADADGKPMHSWRVLILPYLDANHIYVQYRFDEPWDSPHNFELARKYGNEHFRCASSTAPPGSRLTNYVAIVGPGTPFPGAGVTTLDDLHDGKENTILLAEIAESNIHWMEPRDLRIDEMSFQLNDRRKPGLSSPHDFGPGVVFADAITTYRVGHGVKPKTLRALTTIAGREPVTRKSLIHPDGPPIHLNE
ncbi:MAG TPA: DUF1559 domain-containing protein [Planctomycetaceae bacterium]|nr:DUF1559 domain-containing protein [Planctomycetaceae bacterium]